MVSDAPRIPRRNMCSLTLNSGQFLAVGWSDGVVRLMGLENNKAVHHIEICQHQGPVKIAHIGWGAINITGRSSQTLPSHLKDGLSDIFGNRDENTPTDLARELTFLEIETALPKISPLPGSSASSG